jgi:tight adherence protein C
MAAGLAFMSAALATLGLGLLVPSASGGGALRLATAVGRQLRPGALPAGELGARIAAAGAPGGLGLRDVMAVKLACAVAGGGLGLLLGTAAPGRLGILTIALGPAACFLAPDLWLARRAAERAQAMRRELPSMLDLLRVSVESGMSLGAALGAVGERTSGPLAREWRTVGGEVRLGVPSPRRWRR